MDTTADFSNEAENPDQKFVHESLAIQLRPAPILRRVLAYAIDLGIVSVALYAAFLLLIIPMAIFIAAIGSLVKGLAGSVGGILLTVLLFLVLFLLLLSLFSIYFVWFEYKKGTTLGKKIFGLKVISMDQSKLRLSQCVGRDFMRLIDAGLVLPGLISMLLTDRHQRLGDLLAGTLVIYSSRSEAAENFLYMNQDDYHYLLAALEPRPIPPSLMQSYLQIAYPVFSLGTRGMLKVEEDRWLPLILKFVPKASELELNPDVLLRFFAEHCFQTTNKMNSSKN